MWHYVYDADNMTCINVYPSLGRAIDAAMMDFASGQTFPVKIQDANYVDIFDAHDLHWIYSRTWNKEYDRATGEVTQRSV